MSLLSFVRDDRFHFASMGAATVGVIAMMYHIMQHHRDNSQIKPIQPRTQYITQQTEDTLKLGTLDSLLGHYNFAIRETSAKIVCDRAVHDGTTITQLLWGITRPDYEERMKNLRALAMITDQHHLHLLNSSKAYSAFVRSLELCAGEAEYETLDNKHFDDYYLRDMAEKMCLMFVLQLINKYDTKELIQAKFVEKWLAQQKWGDTDEERQGNFAQYMKLRQNRITDICQRLRESGHGRNALVKAKLLPEGSSRHTIHNEDGTSGFSIVLSISMNENGDLDDTPLVETIQPRILEQSAEEQRLRRHNRQAMVLNDGTHPLGRADIIEPDRD